MLTTVPAPILLSMLLAVPCVFGCAVLSVDPTHRLALSLLCLIGSGVYLGMAGLNVISHDTGSITIASALLAASVVAALYLRLRRADPWPSEDDAERR